MSKNVDLKIREKAVILITHIYNDKRQTARCYSCRIRGWLKWQGKAEKAFKVL